MSGPLEGVKVLDAGHYIAGPYCAKLLADLGADVVKVERPGAGDGARRIGPNFAPPGQPPAGPLFLHANTSKRGITLDFATPEGRRVFNDLARWADILVENFRPSYLPSLGLGYDDLAQVNPALVVTSITSFGQSGPYRDYQATEMTSQALSGMMLFNGEEDREPLRFPRYQAQMVGGLNAAGVSLAALFYARDTGEGQQVDVSIQESVATFYYSNVALYAYTGMVSTRGLGELYPCQDGWVMPTKGRAPWDPYAIFFDAMELVDEKYQTPQGQQRYAHEIREVITARLASRERYEVFHSGQEAGFPFGLVQTLDDVDGCPQLAARGFFQDVAHPHAGTARYASIPFKMGGSPPPPLRPAPLLGQHNRQVYLDTLGYSEERLSLMEQNRVV